MTNKKYETVNELYSDVKNGLINSEDLTMKWFSTEAMLKIYLNAEYDIADCCNEYPISEPIFEEVDVGLMEDLLVILFPNIDHF